MMTGLELLGKFAKANHSLALAQKRHPRDFS
uniref:Uncharacterized protein n=1 Tax=Streptococcus dysgalactiae subsp. equisimilis TaxID=119602 RepID=A8D7U6_STREQ|nr:hypothetical protein ICESde3396_19 [Streptococcus dysgalactiae subsp. equisimilis]